VTKQLHSEENYENKTNFMLNEPVISDNQLSDRQIDLLVTGVLKHDTETN
jgi:hypothetical protein